MRPPAAGRRFAIIITVGTKPSRSFGPLLLMCCCEDRHSGAGDAFPGSSFRPLQCSERSLYCSEELLSGSKFVWVPYFYPFMWRRRGRLKRADPSATGKVPGVSGGVGACRLESTRPALTFTHIPKPGNGSNGFSDGGESRGRVPPPSADAFKMSGQTLPASLCWNIQFHIPSELTGSRRVGACRAREFQTFIDSKRPPET